MRAATIYHHVAEDWRVELAERMSDEPVNPPDEGFQVRSGTRVACGTTCNTAVGRSQLPVDPALRR